MEMDIGMEMGMEEVRGGFKRAEDELEGSG